MKNILLPAATLAVTSAFLLSACGSGSGDDAAASGSAEAQKGGTVHMLQNADFSYLDPARGFDGGVNAFYRLMYRGLTMQAAGDADDPNAMVPDMAESLGEASDDGKTWTYKLKEGLKFDNGDPITSKEMKFGISRAWDPSIGIGSPYLKQVIDAPEDYQGPYVSGDLDTIETPDEKTIVFHLKESYTEFDAVLAQPNAVPFPEGSGKGDEFVKDVIASGPYDLESYTPGSVIKLKRNPNWDPATDEVRKAYPDAWEVNLGIDPATIDERLMADQGADTNAIGPTIQAATLPRLQEPQLQDRVVDAPATCTTYMSMNMTKDVFKDEKVRQAVNYAIDRSAVVTASGGTQLADPATTITPPIMNSHKDYDLYPSENNEGDLDKAKELLDEAGVSDGLSFTLDINAADKMSAQAQAIQEQLAKINVDVKLNVIDTSTFYETIGTPAKQHDAAITGWCPDWASSSRTFLPPLFDSDSILEKGNGNLAQISDPEIDKRIDEIEAMTDLDAANVEWGELDEEIMQKAPIAPLAWEKGKFLPGSNITNYHPANLTDLTIIGLKDPSAGN